MEAGLQEAVLEQTDSLVLSKLTSLSQNLEAKAPVVGILAALGQPGGSGRMSLGHAFAKAASSKKLKGEKAAKGLQAFISHSGQHPALNPPNVYQHRKLIR